MRWFLKREYTLLGTHSFLKIGGISPFLYAKATYTHSTPLFSRNFILPNALHACSHLLFPESVTKVELLMIKFYFQTLNG
jgi:hypothetical protein